MRYPDEPIPEIQMSLREFHQTASRILNGPDTVYDFCRMVLAGRVDVDGTEHRIFVNARQDLEEIRPSLLTITRDYDSICACTHNLPFIAPFSIFPIPPFREALTSDNHLTGKAYDKQGERIEVPLHKIPNVALGKTNTRHVTRMVFPRLYDAEKQEPAIPSSTLSKIYDECIRPAVRAVASSRLSHWPPSYSAALNQARDLRGRLHFGTIDLSPNLLEQFVAVLKRKLSEIPKLQDVYFMHEVRGTKGFTVHDPENDEERWQTLQRELSFLDFDNITLKDWYIDVGLEVYLPNHVLQWLTDSHPRLLRFGLPKQSLVPNSLAGLFHNRSLFLPDPVAQFREFAGFRCTPGRKGHSDSVVYLNVYTTDKEPTYQLHRGNFRKHNPSELLQVKTGEKLITDVNKMMETFGQCMGNGERAPNEGCARYEVRVALSETPNVLSTMANQLLRDSIVAIPVDLWWEFKFIRLAALRYVLDDKIKTTTEDRALRSSLVLGAVGVWMLDALNFRPNNAIRFQALADACSQHIYPDDYIEDDDDDSDVEGVPGPYNRGIYFLADFMEDPENGAWRVPLPMTDRVDEAYLSAIYGRSSMAILEHDAGIHGVLVPKGSIGDPFRIPNRRKKTTEVQFVRDDIEEDIDLQLAERGVKIRPVAREAGRDVDARSHQVNDVVNAGPDERVASIWKQACHDIFAVGPNGEKSSDPSHIIMSLEARQNVTWDIFKSTNFSKIFENVQIRKVDEIFWTTTLFDRYFPPQGTPPKERGKIQNFPSTTYYNDWFKLMSEVSAKHANIIRSGVLDEFKKLKWLPHAEVDRMWATKKMTAKIWTMYPIGSELKPCPHIAVNLMTWGGERIKLGTRRARGREEQEQESDPEGEELI